MVVYLVTVILSVTVILVLIEVAVFFVVNDFSVPTVTLSNNIKRILVIYPHPDDEILLTGGFMKKYAKDKMIAWVVLSKGERGTPNATIDENLKRIRANEALQVANLLKVKSFVHYDFKDNEILSQKKLLEEKVRDVIEDNKPDLIITYDMAGLYGHPDHIVTSELVTRIAKEKHIQLWYATNSKNVLNMAILPEHMATDKNFRTRRKYPNVKVFVGLSGTIAKSRGVSIYRSQLQSFLSAYPVKWIPLPVYNLPMIFEYFYQVQD